MSAPDDQQRSTFPAGLFWLGILALLVSLGASAILAAQQLDIVQAPGCGDDSPCAAATSSRWGTVPGLRWPLSFVGAAYFAGLLGAWAIAKRSGITSLLKHLVRLGGVLSALLIVAMIVGGYLCPYCLAAHLANFVFLAAVELAPRAERGTRAPLAWAAAVFALVTLVEAGGLLAARAVVEEQLRDSTQRIAAGSPDAAEWGPFTGRYRVGPERAPIRIVIISDYQCPDCRRIEQQARQLLAVRDDVSFSAKHFPFCPDCNPVVRNNPHPNACWAARAAETAGILRGDEGFYQMHRWLFDRGGAFTNPELTAGVREMGYDPHEFFAVMQSQQPLQRVQADIAEAVSLGLHFTPMVFINAVELKGWQAPNALVRAVEHLASTNPSALTATADRPPTAATKYIEDWQLFPARHLPSEPQSWALGPDDAAVQIVIWGDYQEPNTAAVDRCVREVVAARSDVRYAFRHYPFNADCNPQTQQRRFPLACLAHRAAEAAGALGGNGAYWAMHEWLMDNQAQLTPESLGGTARALGLDPDALISAMASPEVADAIARDANAGSLMRLRSIPLVYINGKRLPRWRYDDRCLIPQIVELAATGTGTGN